MADDSKCGHDMCACGVAEGVEYCSDHCRDAAGRDMIEIKCDCGHPACE